ncbi:hypothetical protein HYH03_009894 [Edaphochlamys debaryana]|uniref:Uncharacterized protein n=1 Tax=Edaphochlamys debaryana TaxID=47281 RepID=A0A835XWZ1_9CHLO|nr:hypothetical protein HYH03_009894 [Edaphochlamys debaryana]|eukprot:KAG2491731.1 hypothetical protein HYH03_009894 [Edaphochlamys debaryana]
MPGIAGEVDPELVSLLVDGARYGDMEDVHAALTQGVPVDSLDGAGRTALHMACANGHEDIIARLLEAGASTSVKNEQGNTPLHWACLNGHKEAVRLLMDKGASAAVLNEAGRTPLDEALSRDYQEIFELITSYGTGGGVSVEVVEEGAEGEDVGDDGGEPGAEGEGEEEGEDLPEVHQGLRLASAAAASGAGTGGAAALALALPALGGAVLRRALHAPSLPPAFADEKIGPGQRDENLRAGMSKEGDTFESPVTEQMRNTIASEAVQGGFFAGMHRTGDMTLREVDEQGQVTEVKPDPDAPRGYIFHKQSQIHAIANAWDDPNSLGGTIGPKTTSASDRSAPAGPVASALDPERPSSGGETNVLNSYSHPGRLASKVADVARGVATTLATGVNNPGQPETAEELRRTVPEGGQGSTTPAGPGPDETAKP